MQSLLHCIDTLKSLADAVTQLNSYIQHQSCAILAYRETQIIECKWLCCLLGIADSLMHH